MLTTTLSMMIGSALLALAFGYLAWTLLSIAHCPRVIDAELGRFEKERRERLRRANWMYRNFEPLIDELVAADRGQDQTKHDKLRQDLMTSAVSIPWQPAEYVAARLIEAIAAAAVGGIFGYLIAGPMLGFVIGIVAFFGYRLIMGKQVRSQAAKRRLQVKRRFAAMIDLMALMMEVGGSFQESLVAVAGESKGHPLGDELQQIIRDTEMGKSRRDALAAFINRLNDEDTSELVTAVIEGEKLGTPLASILRTQANQMRQKRSQWAEKIAEESQVAIVFPAMIIMLACLLIVAAPFVLTAVMTFGGM